jgi:alpha-beta hydrolase superfamily lysophospholipase
MKIRIFRTSDDYYHHYRHWEPSAGVPRAYVVALHGIQSHSGWYGYSSQRLSDQGFDVRFLDRRGSGLNGCERGHTPHYERLLNDVRQFLVALRAERDIERPGAPILLTGISWGGKVAAAVAIQFPDLVDGVGLLYPGICAKVKPTGLQQRLLKLARLQGQGKRRVTIPLDDPALFTGEPEWQSFIRNDRYALRQVSLDFLQASLDLEKIIQKDASKLSVPLLMLLAGQDEIIDNGRTLALMMKFGAPQENLVIYQNARHTLEFEPNRHEIFSDLIDWMNHLSRRTVIG